MSLNSSAQVRARKVCSTTAQNSAATVTINSGEVCSSVTLKPAPKSPVLRVYARRAGTQPSGTMVIVDARANCAGGSSPGFRYDYRIAGASWTLLSSVRAPRRGCS